MNKEAILSAHLQGIAEQTERACATYNKRMLPPLNLTIIRLHLAQLWADAYDAGHQAGLQVRTYHVLSRLILPCTPADGVEDAP